MSVTIDNVYDEFKKIVPIELSDPEFIVLRSYQVIPRYYLFSTDTRVIILNYATGTGKTISGLFTILDRLHLNRVAKMFNNVHIRRPIVVGFWQTHTAFKSDMMRPMFNMIDRAYVQRLKRDEKDDDAIQHAIELTMGRYINFLGYQMLFNQTFPYYAERNVQDIGIMFADMKQGKLKVNQKFVDELNDNVMIVDEMQQLYSQSGLNTYGFTVAYLLRHTNMKLVMMSGTVFNSSISELGSVLYICGFDVEPFMKTETIDDMTLLRIQPNRYQGLIDLLKPHYLFYTMSTKEVYQQSTFADMKLVGYHPNADMVLTYSAKDYPKVVKIGNIMVDETMMLYMLPANGYQKRQLGMLHAIQSLTDELESEDDQVLSIYDAAIPPQSEWSKHGIMRTKTGLYIGPFLDLDKLIQYSRLGVEAFNLSLFNARHGEKTVLYHSRLSNFGLLQYGEILRHNGLLHYGESLRDNSLCKTCGRKLIEHIPGGTCNQFTPVYYEFMAGFQKPSERASVLKLFNHPNNIHGDLIAVLLISDVAYTGVTFRATTNLAVLARVPNISKLQQINARIVRMHSQDELEPDKRVAKLYLYGVAPVIDKNTDIYRYYRLRSMANEDIDKFVDDMSKAGIGQKLIHTPETLELSKDEQRVTSQLYSQDASRYIVSITDTILGHINGLWRPDALLKYFKDASHSYSFINFNLFPDDYLMALMTKSSKIRVFHTALGNMIGPVGFDTDCRHAPTIKFDQIVNDDLSNIDEYKHMVESAKSPIMARRYFMRLMQTLNIQANYKPLVGWSFLKQYVYDNYDEAYDDDQTNFFVNHSNRDIKKVCGFYWSNQIIRFDGSSVRLKYSFLKLTPHPEMGLVFIITASTGLHTVIYQFKEEEHLADDRYGARGNDCWNYKNPVIMKHYKKLANVKNIVNMCSMLITELSSEQINSPVKFVASPFEKTTLDV